MDSPDSPTTAELLRTIEALQQRIQALEGWKREMGVHLSVLEKAFRVIGLGSNYVEFGAYRGDSLIHAGFAAWRVLEEALRSHYLPAIGEARTEELRQRSERQWARLRFFAFDSFAGIPAPTGCDLAGEVFQEGFYACSEEELRKNLTARKFPIEKLVTVPGYFEDTCVPATAERIGLERVGIVHIDCDLYASAAVALEFITPYLRDSSIVIFDDWFQYLGHPECGEQRAFREWRERHPEFTVTEFHKEGAWAHSFVLTRGGAEGG